MKLFVVSHSRVQPLPTHSDVAPGTSTASTLGIIPTTSLATDKQQFSPHFIGRLKALMSKEKRTQIHQGRSRGGCPLTLMHMHPRMRQAMMVTHLMQEKMTL